MADNKSDRDLPFLPRSYAPGAGEKEETGVAEDETPPRERKRHRGHERRNRKRRNDREAAGPEPEETVEPETYQPDDSDEDEDNGDDELMAEDHGFDDEEDRSDLDDADPFVAPLPERTEGSETADLPTFDVRVAGVRFGYACRIYYFDAGDVELEPGDIVLVKTEKGLALGGIAMPPFTRRLDALQLEGLRRIIRKADRDDLDRSDRLEKKEEEAHEYCLERIEALGLPMKLVDVECFFDASKYVFYFTAEGRVDFRDLVKELVARFPARIEMRQIGVRHEAKMIGGVASCGQELCCSRFLTDFKPVSVKMAKNQHLSLNPSKISGVCGRLMCCLAYEHEIYEDFKKGLPKVGKAVETEKGRGIVQRHCPLSGTVVVQFDEETLEELPKSAILGEVDTRSQRRKEKKPGGAPKQNRGPKKKSKPTETKKQQ